MTVAAKALIGVAIVGAFFAGRGSVSPQTTTPTPARSTPATRSEAGGEAVDPELDAQLDAASSAMLDSSNECLISVRERKTKFANTPSCTALREHAAHMDNPGGKTVLKYELRFCRAQQVAWAALAVSESGKTHLSLW